MKTSKPVESLIVTLRGQRVLFDADLAALFGVPTKRLNEQVKRNQERFPGDFMFQLNRKEWADFKSIITGENAQHVDAECDVIMKSQFATSNSQPIDYQYDGELVDEIIKENPGGRRTLPFVFTEHGALMAANVLNSKKAIQMSVFVIRAFVRQRALLMTQSDILRKLAQIDKKLLAHDEGLRVIWGELEPLLRLPPDPPSKPIGFHVKERRASYGSPKSNS